VAAIDLFPTLARIAGAKVPADRPIDGVDQLDFLTGRQETSNREHVLLFLGQRLMAIKWRNFKIHLEGLDRVDGVFEDWSFPRGFNLAADPKERWNILWQNTWIGERVGPFVAAYQASVKKYPNLAAPPRSPDDSSLNWVPAPAWRSGYPGCPSTRSRWTAGIRGSWRI
jgi:arylsulfatase